MIVYNNKNEIMKQKGVLEYKIVYVKEGMGKISERWKLRNFNDKWRKEIREKMY